MTYELSTLYHYNLRLTDEQFDAVFEKQVGAGASRAIAWLGLTGPFTGVVAMTSRWTSLDTMIAWAGEIAEAMSPGGQFHEYVEANPMVSRIVSKTDVLVGNEDTAYSLVTRGMRRTAPDGIEEAIATASMRCEADGCRGSTLILAGEWTGQVVGQFYSNSADVLANLPERLQGDTEVTEFADEAGLTVLSRTLFRRLASTSKS